MAKDHKKEGYTFGGMFGIELQSTMTTLRKLLKPHGLTIERKSNGDDQSWVRVKKRQ